jgi:hypothetical protein
MGKIRKGVLLGIISSIIIVSGLFLKLVNIKDTNNLPLKFIEEHTAWDGSVSDGIMFQGIFIAYIIISLVIFGGSIWSNKRHYVSLITLVSSIASLALTLLLLGGILLTHISGAFVESALELPENAKMSVGVGWYALLIGSVLGLVSSILVLKKR